VLVGRQAVVALILVDVGLSDPVVRRGLGDADVSDVLADGLLILPGGFDRSATELSGQARGILDSFRGDIVASG